MSTAKWHLRWTATSVRLCRDMSMIVPSCQLPATASIDLHTYITTGRRPVCAELHAIAMQNSCMNVPIIKFTRIGNTKGKWFSPNLKAAGKPWAIVKATSDILWSSCSSKPYACKTSFGAIFTIATSACLCTCAWSSTDRARDPRSSRETCLCQCAGPDWSSVWTLTPHT